MATCFKAYILIFWLIIIPNSIHMVSQPADRVLPKSCTLVPSSTCRINSTKCSITTTFSLQRPLDRLTEYDISWWFNNKKVSGSDTDFGASEMTTNCITCSAGLHILVPLKQHHFGDYAFEIRRILPDRMSRRINCSLRLCEDCQPSITKEEGASKPNPPYIYIVAGVAGFFIVTTLLLIVKILFSRNKGKRQSSHPQPGGAIYVDDVKSLIRIRPLKRRHRLPKTSQTPQPASIRQTDNDWNKYVVATSSTSPGASGPQVKPEVVYAEVSKPTRNDPNPQQLPDVVDDRGHCLI